MIGPTTGRVVAGLRLLTAVLLVAAFVLPVGLVSFTPSKWLPCVILAVVLVLAAAGVSAHADDVEEKGQLT